MARTSSYTPELIGMVQAAIIAGHTYEEIAKTFNISKSTVGNIKNKIDKEKSSLDKIKDDENYRIDVQLMTSLKNHLDALNAIAEVAKDKDYLRGQKASDLSQLHTTIETHIVRLLQSSTDEPSGE